MFDKMLLIAFWAFLILALSVAGLTVVWLCLRAAARDSEAMPRWGDLRPLKRLPQKTSIVLRILVVCGVAGLMVIPIDFIYDLTMERYRRYMDVVEGISSTWGESQTVVGPVMSIPYIVRYQVSENVPLSAAELALEQARSSDRTTKEVVRTVESSHRALVLPEELSIDARVSTEVRTRGIYSTRVYTADMTVTGFFAKPEVAGLRQHITEIRWGEAEIAVGLSSTKAIRDISELTLSGKKLKFLPGTGGVDVLSTGFSGLCDIPSFGIDKPIEFSFRLSIGGSESLFFAPVGVVNQFRISSEWPHPSFKGSGLPSFREVTNEGFSAVWNIPNLVRNYPQVGDMEMWNPVTRPEARYSFESNIETARYQLTEYVAGVEFFEPVFHYSLLIRAAKHAALFITLTFLGVVIFENGSLMRNKTKLGIIQYCVIGLGLSMFYLTLLALSEHIGFTAAYLAAALVNMSMTAVYVGSALRHRRPMRVIGLQGVLYLLLFFILRMEDYSLLAGSVILLAAIAALMTVTRNMNQPENSTAQDS
ncbi:MAG: cell envelope integrity protein CreD [Synergistaceae bacterium]|nr:cell envelope integrity protein CreD [Synergistaceae bacterium]